MTTSTLLTPQSITATGGGNDLDIAGLTGKARFTLTSLNTAGTSPTLACKLQHSIGATQGVAFLTAGATDNKLREGATTTVKLSQKFTQSGARQIKSVSLMLKKIGTLAAGKLLTLDINTNNAGVPSATSLGTSATVSIDDIVGTSYASATFTFAKPVDVADATIYHFVLSGDYTASGTNCVVWRSLTVASGGGQSTFDDTTWTAVATQDFEVYAYQYNFADVTGGGFAALSTAGTASVQTLELNVNSLRAIARLYSTIGGTSNPAWTTAAVVNANSVQEA